MPPMTLGELFLGMLIGFPIWAILYFGFFGALEWCIRHNCEDPNIPRYLGDSHKPRGKPLAST